MSARIHLMTVVGLFLAALIVLSGCGTLDVAVEPASQPTATTAAPIEPTAAPTTEPTTKPTATAEPTEEVPIQVTNAPAAEEVAVDDADETLGCRTTVSEGTSEWVACNIMDGITSRNTAALPGFMVDPFIIGYWRSEGISVTPEEAIANLQGNLLPIEPGAYPMTFTVDRSQFPSLMGVPVEGMFGPDVAIAHIIYSTGWGQDGQGETLIFIAQNEAGFYWHGLVFSPQSFDQ